MLSGSLQNCPHVAFGFDDRDHLGDQPVEAGIRPVGKAPQFVDDDLAGREVLTEGLDQFAHKFVSCFIFLFSELAGGCALRAEVHV